MLNIEKNITVKSHGIYAATAERMEKGDSVFTPSKNVARKIEQALRNVYRKRKYGVLRINDGQTVKGITTLRRQKDDDGNVIGYRVWLMVDMLEYERERG